MPDLLSISGISYFMYRSVAKIYHSDIEYAKFLRWETEQIEPELSSLDEWDTIILETIFRKHNNYIFLLYINILKEFDWVNVEFPFLEHLNRPSVLK